MLYSAEDENKHSLHGKNIFCLLVRGDREQES